VSVPALGTSSSAILAADATGSIYNIKASDLQFISPPTGITLNVAADYAWITQSGADEESDDSLRTRIVAKWGSLSATGSYDAYVFAGLSSSPEVNRVRIQEDPTAVDPTPMVRVWLAGTAGPIGSSTLTTSTSYILARSPLGVRVSVENTTPYNVTIRGTYKVKASQAAAAKAYIAKQFGDWFAGRSIVVNGETVPGLGIGDGVLVAQVMEIIMSAPGVSTVTLDDGAGSYLPKTAWFDLMTSPPAADEVPVLITSDTLLVPVLTA
jgi:phage-related baseplate assembly protein